MWLISPRVVFLVVLSQLALFQINLQVLLPNCYNLWRGFAINPERGDWSLYNDHIFYNIAKGNEDYYLWILAWMARVVQDPGGKKPGTAIAIRGKQGTGKGVFANYFGKLSAN